ncbi:uncharacterized protein [Rutidosis leptorrhynchoides]|uniref:uncharacterized protein n=1 Tax=Rutidosis leptorrhynchoides TaxID=125765 RepID=UPI003A998E5B
MLWAHRITPKRITGETPFSLVYGTEAVIPAEICVLTQRIMAFDIEANSYALRENLNLLEEIRLMAAIQQADHKHKMAKYYNKKVKHTQFEVGDLVLRDNEASTQIKFGKLAPKWKDLISNYSYGNIVHKFYPAKDLLAQVSHRCVSSLPAERKITVRW